MKTTLLLAAVALAAVCVGGVDTCTPPAPTVTFSAACTTIDPSDASCWTPHAPTATDSVVFPAGTKATWHPATSYRPLIVEAVTVAAGATVTLGGGGVQATKCFAVLGKLTLQGSALTGAPSGAAYRGDPTTPEGTDCAMVAVGFTPRVCGPGPLVVAKGSAVTVGGLYASIFAGVVVEAGATLTLGDGAFLWGNTTVNGELQSTGRLFLHGFLFNYGTSYMAEVRSDYWHTFYARPKPIVLHNVKGAVMNVTSYISTDIPSYYGKVYPTYRISVLNDGTLTFYYAMFGKSGVDIVNTGTVQWIQSGYSYSHHFYHVGTAENFGTFIADSDYVTLTSYTSHGGRLVVRNGGAFLFDNGAGVDEGVVELCRKRREAPRTEPLHVSLKETAVVRSNISCAKSPCPSNLCCGKDLVCETPRCFCDYGGGPPCCCQDNAFCGGSSHGPYCGSGFGWEVDADCMESEDHVERSQFELVMKRFGRSLPPRSRRTRYSLRGDTTIGGDGVVRIGQAIAVSGRVRIEPGVTVRVMVEHGAVALPGRGVVEVAGTLALGIRTRVTAESVAIAVREGGVLRVPRACTVQLSTAANVTVTPRGTLRVDGQLLIDAAPTAAASLCGATAGRGAIIGAVDAISNCRGQ